MHTRPIPQVTVFDIAEFNAMLTDPRWWRRYTARNNDPIGEGGTYFGLIEEIYYDD